MSDRILIVVTRIQDNPEYRPERFSGGYGPCAPATLDKEILRCEIPDQTYNALRRSMLAELP